MIIETAIIRDAEGNMDDVSVTCGPEQLELRQGNDIIFIPNAYAKELREYLNEH